jgi:hypothetical protein
LAYRPREVVVVALLAGGLFGGLAVERWRARQPAAAERLEAEPPRLTSAAPVQRSLRPRPRSVAARCEEPGSTRRGPAWVDAPLAQPRLDLNRATPGELAHVARISWRLAARIIAARDAFEGRDRGGPEPEPDEARSGETAAPATGTPDAPDATSDTE